MSLHRDVRFGLRQLQKRPGLTLVTLATLALGIGVNTAIFSIVKGVLFETAPFEQAERLVWIGEESPQISNMSVAYPNFLDWQERSPAFEALAAHRFQSLNLTGLERPEQLFTVQTSASLFAEVLRVEPWLGRTFDAEEDQPGQGRVAIVTHDFWRTRLGADEQAVGRTLQLDGEPYEVIGVMPAGFYYPLSSDRISLWTPIGHLADEPMLTSRGNHPGIYVTGRLADGFSLEQGRTQMRAVAAGLAEEFPETNTGHTITVRPLREHVVRNMRPAVMTLAVAVLLVLLLACVNVANLLTMRGTARAQEIAVRTALGARRGHLVRQLLVEACLLSLAGGLLGVLLAQGGLRLLLGAIDQRSLPVTGEVEIDAVVLLFSLGLSLATGVLFGTAPALQALRLDLVSGLKEGAKTSDGPGRHRLKSSLVVAQVALAMVLLIGATLFIGSFARLTNADPGFDDDGVVTFAVSLPERDYPQVEQAAAFFETLVGEVRAVPGVELAAFSLPVLGGWQHSFIVEGQPKPAPGERQSADYTRVSPDFFATMGIDLQRGRVFDETDGRESEPVIVVDRTFADTHFPGLDPIGRRVKLSSDPADDDAPWRTVVGVVDHVKSYGVARFSRVEVYIPYAQLPSSRATFLFKSSLDDPLSLMPPIEQALQRLDKDQPVAFVRRLDEITGLQTLASRVLAGLLSAFGVLAMVLAALGIYGVVSFQVGERRREIAVRMAMGARRGHVLGLVAGRGARLIGTGVVLGTVLALLGGPLLESQLYGVSARDAQTFIVVPLLLFGAGLLACLSPLYRASRIEPVQALRHE